jgi:hypothetical protein
MIIFIKTKQNIEYVNSRVVEMLEITKNESNSRESVNNLYEEYYSIIIGGIEIKIENNCYDYEDQYNITIFIKNHWSNTIDFDNIIIDLIGLLLLKLLSINFKGNIAYMNSLSDKLIRLD